MKSNGFDYLKCPTCGMGLNEIKEKHSIGCLDCWFFFRGAIVDVLLQQNDDIAYKGNYQRAANVGESAESNSIEKLKILLEKSVEKEDYEMAIYFRERIKNINKYENKFE